MTKKYLLIFGLLFAISFSVFNSKIYAQDQNYLVGINYDQGKVNFGQVTVKQGVHQEPEIRDGMGENKYWIELKSFNGETLEKRMFSISLLLFYDNEEGSEVKGGIEVLKQVSHLEVLPYYNNGEMLYLYDEKMNKLDEKDVGHFAEMCGDGICQKHEFYINCADDCAPAAKDGYCNEEKMDVDPDCEGWLTGVADTDKPNEKISSIYYFAAGIVIILIVISGFVLLRKKDKELDNN